MTTYLDRKPAAPMPLGGKRGVLAVGQSLLRLGEEFVLAFVVSTRGSTYRKPGELALIAQDGNIDGVISGGCLEPTLQDAAIEALRARLPRLVVFDTQHKDDLIFGSGSACRGLMKVLLLPVIPARIPPLYTQIEQAHAARAPSKFALSLSAPHLAECLVWRDGKRQVCGEWAMALESLRDAATGEHRLAASGGDVDVAVFEAMSAPHVLLIGAGPEALQLIRMSRSLGWFMTLIDHRAAVIDAHASYVDHLLPARPQVALRECGAMTFDAALVMTHSAAVDLEALQALATRTEPFVGLLGPPARRDELLKQLRDDERAALTPRLHAPLGIRLGGNGPEAIALSVAAELQRFFHGLDA